MGEKDLIDIYIIEILVRHSSKENKLTQKEVIEYLKSDYNMDITRNTLSRYLTNLRSKGYVEGERGICCKRIFSQNEIAILVNSIMAAKAVPGVDIQNLIEKLKDMSEPEKREEFCKSYFLVDVNHTDNENVGFIMDTISKAINRKKKIRIISCRYDVAGALKDGKTYIVDPYYIVAEKSRYYLLCHGERNDVEPRRIDRIKSVEILNKENRMEIFQIEKYKNHTFRIEDYMKEHIYMYSGESERVTIKIKKKNIGDFFDWFGKEYRKMGESEEEIIVQVKANVNAVYFWALQYSEIAEVMAPEKLRVKLREGARRIGEMYE